MKLKLLFVGILFIFSINSVVYATADVPEHIFEETVPSDFHALTVHSGDELRWIINRTDQEPSTIYTVVKGDNLYRIALTHNISVESLKEWNNLGSALIYPGDELKVIGEAVVVSKKEESVVSSVPVETPSIVKVEAAAAPEENVSKEMVVTATAYTAYCEGCSGTTAYGIDLRANPDSKVIAVDKNVIPLGTKVWVEGYGVAIAGDTGGAIKGNKIDVFIPSYENAMAWGVKKVKIKVLN